jgi:hydrogenase nickel incorporation protein HypA/HybF
MHELSIAESIVSIADRHAGGRKVVKVEVKVGHLRQVVPSALEFAFGLVAQGTPVEGADLELEEVPAAGLCRNCGREGTLAAFPFTCPGCGGMDLQVTQGEELLVDSLELEEPVTTSGG